MAEVVLLPRQGNSVESCIILEWKKGEGESVSQGETICEVETDKATFEVESTASGVLRKQLVSEGDDVPVLDPIAVIGEAQEDISSLLEGEALPPAAAAAASDTNPSPTGEATSSAGTAPGENASGFQEERFKSQPQLLSPDTQGITGSGAGKAVSPRARFRAGELGIESTTLTGSGPGGRVIERDVLAAAAQRGALTSAARSLLAGSAEPPSPESSTGAGGRFTTGDAARAGSSMDTPRHRNVEVDSGRQTGRVLDSSTGYPGEVEDLPVKGVRKVIAERTLRSLQETAQLTLHRRADARALLSYRSRLKESGDEGLAGISLNDLIHFAVVKTLTEFPELNGHFLGESIRLFKEVHLGFAVDTPRGLMVPTIVSAQRLTLRELSVEAKRLARLAVEAKAGSEELRTETFTVTNLGSLGIDYFTPVLNPPALGILGVGGIEPHPASLTDPQAFIPKIALSLTVDHQGIDGAPGARFLDRLAERIASIDLALAG